MFVRAFSVIVAAGTVPVSTSPPVSSSWVGPVKGLFVDWSLPWDLIYMRGMNLQIWAECVQALAWVLIIPASRIGLIWA